MKRKKSRILAAILAFMFGSFGVHRFYLGEIGAGIFFVLLMIITSAFRLPITSILGFIDAVRFLTMSQRDFDRRYNADYYENERRNPQRSSRRGRDQYNQRSSNKRNSKSRVNPYKKTGIQKYKDFEIHGAIKDFEEGLKIDPKDIALHFNLACAYSMEENKVKSLDHLAKAIQYGFKDVDKIKTHENLAFLRIQDEYEEFVKNGYKLSQPIAKPTENLLQDDILLSQLNKLSELRKKGLLSEEEYVMEKQKLMQN